MQDLLGKWYVPRAEYARMMELHAMEIADLRAQVRQLVEALSVQSVSIEDFEIAEFDDLPPSKADSPSNVVSVDFRRRY